MIGADAPSTGSPDTAIVNLSSLPGSPLSSTVTEKVQATGLPLPIFFVHSPVKVAVVGVTLRVRIELGDLVWTFRFLAWFWYSKLPMT